MEKRLIFELFLKKSAVLFYVDPFKIPTDPIFKTRLEFLFAFGTHPVISEQKRLHLRNIFQVLSVSAEG